MKKALAAVFAAAVVIAATAPVSADPLDKLARGAINTATGWIEIPKVMYEDCVNENILFGLTFGLFHGAATGIYRTGAGLIDIVTFPLKPYDEHIVPEYVF